MDPDSKKFFTARDASFFEAARCESQSTQVEPVGVLDDEEDLPSMYADDDEALADLPDSPAPASAAPAPTSGVSRQTPRSAPSLPAIRIPARPIVPPPILAGRPQAAGNSGWEIRAEPIPFQSHVPRELQFAGATDKTAIPEYGGPRTTRSGAKFNASLSTAPSFWAMSLQASTNTPLSYADASRSPDHDDWKTACESEIASLKKNETYRACKLPADRTAIDTKWVFALKLDKEGNVERFKARVVARGFKQIEGLDFTDTYSPVAAYSSIRTFLAIAANKDWEIQQIDAVTAFLNAPLEEEIYVKPPDGYQESDGKVWKLEKALYGLKQAGRQWWKMLHAALEELHLIPTAADTCIWIARDGSVGVATVVDDMIVAGEKDKVEKVIRHLENKFSMKRLGDVNVFVGLKITRNRQARTLTLKQTRYTRELLKRFNMHNSKTARTPIPAGQQFLAAESGDVRADRKLYQSMVGSVMFLMLGSRPDLAFSCGLFSRYNNDPTEDHLEGLKKVFRYVNGTIDYGSTYGGETNFHGFSDAAFVDDKDTGRSTSGYIFKLCGSAITWSSRRQGFVTTSTTEAEYVATTEAAKEAIWLSTLLVDLGHKPGATTLYCDNQGAIALANISRSTGRTKHFTVRHHFIRECLAAGTIEIKYVSTHSQLADALTKPVALDLLKVFCIGNSIGS